MPRPYNHHHAVWEKRWYKTPIEKAFRNHKGLVIPMWIEAHDDLHAELQAPPKPSRHNMLGALAMMDDLSNAQLNDYLCVVEKLGGFMVTAKEPLGVNLMEQANLLRDGIYK